MIVKICGITRAQDALQAVELGATAVGFVFWPSSPRRITPDAARSIVAQLPASTLKVGVFVDELQDEIERVADRVGLDQLQLHGQERPDFARALTRPCIKAIGLGPGTDDALLAGWEGMRVLLDAHDPVRRGGTGLQVDWVRAARIARRRDIILAGGLTAENIVDAVRAVRPAGVDVSSGVERAPGIKDERRMAALFDALAAVEAACDDQE